MIKNLSRTYSTTLIIKIEIKRIKEGKKVTRGVNIMIMILILRVNSQTMPHNRVQTLEMINRIHSIVTRWQLINIQVETSEEEEESLKGEIEEDLEDNTEVAMRQNEVEDGMETEEIEEDKGVTLEVVGQIIEGKTEEIIEVVEVVIEEKIEGFEGVIEGAMMKKVV